MPLNGEWNFMIDKAKLSRNVPVKEGLTLAELERVIIEEFGVDVTNVSLSYWLKNIFEFVTGRHTPPVLVTTDTGLCFFLKLFEKNNDMNLFVSFGQKRTRGDEHVGRSECKKRNHVLDHELSDGFKSSPVLLDDEFLAQVEEVEAKMGLRTVKRGHIVKEVNLSSSIGNGDGENKKGNATTSSTKGAGGLGPNISDFPTSSSDFSDGWKDAERSDGGLNDPVWEDCGDDCVPDEAPIPRGYDTEFWAPLLDDEFAGSNAVEVMCSSNDAFDHSVLLNSGGNVKSQVKPNTYGSIASGISGQAPLDSVKQAQKESTRSLAEVCDDEFDIPPPFV